MRVQHRPQAIFYLVLLLAAWLVAPATATAADPVVEWSAKLSPAKARAGEHTVVELTAKVPEHWHLYSMNQVVGGPKPLKVTVEGEGIEAVGDWHAPAPTTELDPNFNKQVEFYEGEISHRRAFVVSGEPGARTVRIGAKGQICDPSTCITVKHELELELSVVEGEMRAEYASAPELPGQAMTGVAATGGDGDPSVAVAEPGKPGTSGVPDPNEGLAGFLVASFLAGFAALLTPCVFPMIPVTIAFFSKQRETSRKRSVLMAGTYSSAIVVCFTLLGVGASLLFGASFLQNAASSIPFNIFMFVLLFVFGLSLVGLFEISAPRFLIERSSAMEQKFGDEEGPLGQQLVGAFFMGLTFSLMSFTCTVGLVGILLAQLDAGAHWLYPTLGLFVFAIAFALPFFILALFPSAAQRLRGKAGDWMEAIKITLGILELAGALKFLSNIDLVMGWYLVSRPFVLMVWVGLFLACGLYLWRIIKLDEYDETRHVGVIRWFAGATMVSFALYSASGFDHNRSMGAWLDAWLPPAVMPDEEGTPTDVDGQHFTWIKDDIPGALAQGKAASMPVFVDFTGYTCTNCRMMESSVFPRPNIKDRLDQMVLAQAYTDCDEPVCEEQQDFQRESFQTVALPFYVVYDPHTGKAIETFASSTNKPKEFEAFLQRGLDGFAALEAQRAVNAGPDELDDAGADVGEGEGEASADEDHAAPSDAFAEVDTSLVPRGEAVDFELPSLIDEGSSYKLSSDRGHWVLVNFWASWCAPCKHELENDFPQTFAEFSEVRLVTVAFDGEDTAPLAKSFLEGVEDLPEHSALVGGEDAEDAGLPEVFEVGSGQLPQTYLINPEGVVVWSRAGSVDAALLARLLQQVR